MILKSLDIQVFSKEFMDSEDSRKFALAFFPRPKIRKPDPWKAPLETTDAVQRFGWIRPKPPFGSNKSAVLAVLSLTFEAKIR